MRPRKEVIDNGQKIFAPVINGKADYFFMHTNRDKMFNAIKEYCHLTRDQFFAVGNFTKQVKHPQKRAIFFERVNGAN